MAGGMLLPAGELSLLDQPRDILRAADEYAFHEHHGKGGPAGPHLEDEAAAPFAEITAVLEVLVRDAGGIERLPRLLRKRILPHADDDDVVRRHGRLDLLQDLGPVARDLLAHGGMDLRFGEDSAGHGVTPGLSAWRRFARVGLQSARGFLSLSQDLLQIGLGFVELPDSPLAVDLDREPHVFLLISLDEPREDVQTLAFRCIGAS